MTLGLGLFVGAILSGRVVNYYATPESVIGHDWKSIWIVPAIGATIVLMLFAALFWEKGVGKREPSET